MMRRPNIRSAITDLAFAALAFIAGVLGASLAYAALIALGAVISWAWTRRTALAAMPLTKRAINAALALVMLGAVLGVLYWIGLATGGHL
ncbi:MAG: hypothetical protein H7124_13555 [Phycisphaerales bacterium]|nr:hypothetical protein [Hyphomonadaceae bacterium]